MKIFAFLLTLWDHGSTQNKIVAKVLRDVAGSPKKIGISIKKAGY